MRLLCVFYTWSHLLSEITPPDDTPSCVQPRVTAPRASLMPLCLWLAICFAASQLPTKLGWAFCSAFEKPHSLSLGITIAKVQLIYNGIFDEQYWSIEQKPLRLPCSHLSAVIPADYRLVLISRPVDTIVPCNLPFLFIFPIFSSLFVLLPLT